MGDLRDLLDPDRDRRYPEDLRAIPRALDALALYGDPWGILPPEAPDGVGRAVAGADGMALLEGLPGRFAESRPTLWETGDYRRLLAKVEGLRPEIERLGLCAPKRR